MNYVRLGRSGLHVSPICLGCMSFGDPARGLHGWTLPKEQSRPLLAHAVERGINFFDTANSYSLGSSEEIIGEILWEYLSRDEAVLATKVSGRMRDGPNGAGLSRKAIFAEIDASLRRLRTDYVDLYYIHRWDRATPIEEAMEALHDIVKAGKVRYLGASSMFAWQLAKADAVAARNGWTRFVAMQNHWNLLYREEEREMVPMCADLGIGIVPWSPLARGRLARPVAMPTARSDADAVASRLYGEDDEADAHIIDAVGRIADRTGATRASVALAWLMAQPAVAAPVIGATRIEHIDDALAALDLGLGDEDQRTLERPYRPRAIAGFE